MGEGMGTRGVRTELRRLLVKHFDEEDLRTLCFDLDVPYDRLPGRGTAAKARELIIYLDHRGRLCELVEMCRERRPNVKWPEPSNGPKPDPRSRAALLVAIAVAVVVIVVALKVFAPAIAPKRVALNTYHGRYVTAMGADRDWELVAETAEIKEFERFTLIDLGDGKVAFKTFHKRYVTAADEAQSWDVRAETARIDNWEAFTLIPLGDGKVALKTFHNRYITAMGEDGSWELVAGATEIDLFEEFEIVPLGWFRVMVALGLMRL